MMSSKRISLILLIVTVFFIQFRATGQSTTFPSGSAIIDMGSASPTLANSLKPYGLVYALLKNNHVPVNLVVNASKVKDGIDFAYNSKSYKGGTFIVSGEHISSAITAVLTSWANQGVQIDYTNSTLTVNVTYKINFVPKWVMDRTNGSIGVGFLNSAGIPASAYSFKDPSALGSCDDLFVLPHADPSWTTHNNLKTWNLTHKGAIWAGCHAVSVLENLVNPGNAGDKMNFLSTNGLLAFTDHNVTATPFSNFLHGDPVAQFLSKTDLAQIGGSETVYLPKPGSAWNAGTKIITTSPSQQDVPGLSPGAAVENIYGRAFDDNNRGYVAYQAAHNIGGTGSDQIAAQRIFLNFSLFALKDKVPPIISVSITGMPTELKAGTASGTLSSNNSGTGVGVTYQWTSNVAGTFSTPNAATTTFTPSNTITSATTCIITCVAEESCGRVSFDAKSLKILPPTPPLSANNIVKSIPDGCISGSVSFNVFDSNVDPDAGSRTLVSITGLANGTLITNTNGDVTFTATPNFKGVTTGTYTITNPSAVISSGSISITVGTSTLAPQITNDAATAIANSLTVINVLGNDKNDAAATDGGQLYIRDITVKPTKGYVYINANGTLSYLSTNAPVVAGGDSFQYLACNNSGYCSAGTVNITLVDNCLTGKYQANQTLSTLSATFTATEDSYIDGLSANQGTNFGTTDPLIFNGSSGGVLTRPLLTFGGVNTTLTSTTLVTAATLALSTATAFSNTGLQTSSTTPFPSSATMTVHQVLRPWTELGVTWTSASAAISWTSAGGGNIGNDITTTGASQFPFVANANKAIGDTITADITTIAQSWVSTPTTNYGVRVNPQIGKSTVLSFFSRENATASRRPQLTITYWPCLTTPTNYAPVVYPDATTTSSVASITFNPVTNDANYYGNTNALFSVTTPAHGTATINGNNIIYTPAGNFAGIDTLTYTIKDQTNNQTSTATVRITVTRVAPTILGDLATTNSNTAVTINVGINDSDPQAPGTLSAPTIVTIPKNGVAMVVGNNIVYTPTTGFIGTDVLTYSRTGAAADACTTALGGTATVTITVNNQAPVALNDAASTFACGPVTIKITDNDSDPEGGLLTVNIVSNPSNGTLTATGSGIYKYTPNNGFTGTDNFTYTVSDPGAPVLTSNVATCTITVTGGANPNTAPIAVADTDNTLVNQVVYTNVLANDSDPNGDVLDVNITATGLLTPSNGTIQRMPNKLIKYTPNTNFVGTDTYEYQLTDTHIDCLGTGSLSAITKVTITVKALPSYLTGTVWNDADVSGQADFTNIKTGLETGTNAGGSIYVYLVNSNNKVVDLASVDADGTYSLTNVPSGTTGLKLVVSIENLQVDATLLSPSLPVGYINSSPLTRTLSTTAAAFTTLAGPFDWGIYTRTLLTAGTISGGGNLCGTSATPGTISTVTNAFGGSITATGYVYQWESSTVADFSSAVISIAGATLTSYTASSPITQTTHYRRKVSTNSDAAKYSNVVTFTLNALPSVAITPTTSTIAVGGNISLTASGADTYAWSPSTGLSATNTATVTASPITTTAYTVTGTVSATGCVNTSVVTITVINPGTIGSDESICGNYTPAGLTSTANATGAAGITYQWQISTTSSSSGFANIAGITTATYTPSSAITTTTFYRRVAISGGTSFNSNVVTKTVKSIPTLTASSNSPLCVGAALNLSSTAGLTSYSWSGPNAFTSTSQNPSIANATVAASGTYTLTGTGANGCSNTATTNVTINSLPAITISPVTPTPIAVGGNVSLTASGADSYAWLPSTGLSATNTATVTASPITTTAYTVTGTVSATGCVNTSGVTITVIDPGTIGSDESICGNYTPAGLTSTTGATGAAGITYQWQSSTTSSTSGYANIAGITTASYTPTSAITTTTYYRRVATTGGTTFNSNVVTKTVKALPNVTISASNSTIVIGTSATLTAAGANTYVWTPATGLSATNTAVVTASPTANTVYTVSGTITTTGCINTATLTITVVANNNFTPGTIGVDQTICIGSTPAGLTSITNASGGTGTINYQWQQSTDNITFTNITGATASNYSPGAVSVKTYYRRGASTSIDAVLYSNTVTITTVPPPVITGGISGPCAMIKDSTRTFSVTAAPTATHYVWTVPAGWTGSSTTNSINLKAGSANGTISVTPFNSGCAGNTITYQSSIIDYAQVTITGVPITASGNNNDPVTVTIKLYDPNGVPITCSGGTATLTVCTNTGVLTTVIDNNNGTYSSILTAYADTVTICGTIGGLPILKKLKLTFTGPQGGIKGNGPILATETPKLTFTATAGRAPFTIVYRSAKSNKNDTLTNITSGTPIGVALIPSTTLYTLISISDANGEKRIANFVRDTTTIIVVAPSIIVTLKAEPAVPQADSNWTTRLRLLVKNNGPMDLTSVQVKLNLNDVFPSPVTYQLDSVTINGQTVVKNNAYDGVQQTDLFGMLKRQQNQINTDIARINTAEIISGMQSYYSNGSGINTLLDDATGKLVQNQRIEVYGNTQTAGNIPASENEYKEENHSLYMFGVGSKLPVAGEATMFLYLHLKPNGFYKPFEMQAVALGTGSTEGATALATSLSNDNNDVEAHPEITKKGDPQPTIINLFPTPSIGVALAAGTPVLQGNGSYNVPFSYKLRNYGNVTLTRVQLFENLSRMIGSPATFSIIGPILTTGTLVPNPLFDGKLDSNILLITSQLGLNQEGTINFTVNIFPNVFSALYRVQATGTAFSQELNATVNDLSTNGTNPDPDGNNVPDEQVITLIPINTPIPPLVPGKIVVPAIGYCGTVTGVKIVSNEAISGGSGPYQYQWQISTDNITFTSIVNATDSIYTTGTYTSSRYLRRRVISDNQVAYSNAVFIQVFTVTKPVISASGPLTLAINGTVTLTSSPSNGYKWNTNATTQSIVVGVGGVGPYTVSTTDANACTSVSDPVLVLPPPPVTVDAIYIIGAISNPVNSGVQVSGYATATLNYYQLAAGGVLIPVPVLPGIVGVYTYYVSQTINGYESVRVPYKVTMLDPYKVADIQKILSKAPALQEDGSFILSFNLLASNLRNELLDSVKIKDDLSKVFPTNSTFSILEIKASGKLISNNAFDGKTQIDLLKDVSQLAGSQTDSVQITIKLYPNGFSGVLNNPAVLTAKSPYGTFSINSNDPVENKNPAIRVPTKFVIPAVDIFIPSGFSPNQDGINDKFVITKPFNTTISLDIFNRWGNRVFRAQDYKNEFDGRGNQAGVILGEELPDGTYYYIALATDKTTGTVRKFAGFITLKR